VASPRKSEVLPNRQAQLHHGHGGGIQQAVAFEEGPQLVQSLAADELQLSAQASALTRRLNWDWVSSLGKRWRRLLEAKARKARSVSKPKSCWARVKVSTSLSGLWAGPLPEQRGTAELVQVIHDHIQCNQQGVQLEVVHTHHLDEQHTSLDTFLSLGA